MAKLLTRALALCLMAAVASCAPVPPPPPPAPVAPSHPVVGGATMYPSYTIYQNLQSSADHRTLVSAINASGAATRLQSQGSYTVFAPDDSAFRLLPTGTVEALMHPRSRQELASLVNYHIIPGARTRSQIMADIQAGRGRATYRTAQGTNLFVTMQGGQIVLTDVNGRRSTVSQADISQVNGTFHVVNGVLLPTFP